MITMMRVHRKICSAINSIVSYQRDPAGEAIRRKVLQRSNKNSEEALADTATSEAAAIAVAASSGANFRDLTASNAAPSFPADAEQASIEGAAAGNTAVSRSFLDPLGVFEKVHTLPVRLRRNCHEIPAPARQLTCVMHMDAGVGRL
jgi:hypothetical protein